MFLTTPGTAIRPSEYVSTLVGTQSGLCALDRQYLSGGGFAVGNEFLDAPDGPDGRQVGLHLRSAYHPGLQTDHQPRRGSATAGSFR